MSPTRFFAAVALAASCTLPLAASAQQSPPPAAPPSANGSAPAPMHHGAHFMHALQALNLTDAQKQQIKTAFANTRAANQNADPATRKANMQQLHTQINDMLTPDQRTQLQAEMQKERAAHMAAPPASPAPHA